jgi:hypothetical protein
MELYCVEVVRVMREVHKISYVTHVWVKAEDKKEAKEAITHMIETDSLPTRWSEAAEDYDDDDCVGEESTVLIPAMVADIQSVAEDDPWANNENAILASTVLTPGPVS